MVSPPAESLVGRHPRRTFALGLTVTVVAAALTSSQLQWKPLLEKSWLTVAAMGVTDSLIVRLGARMGFFRDEGLDIGFDDIKIVTSGPESLRLLDRGDVDVAYSTYVPFVFSALDPKIDDVAVVAPTSSARPHSCVIVANPVSGIKSPQQLVGKKVAVTAEESQSAAMLSARLLEVGIDPDDVDIVSVQFSEMVRRVEDGTLDAAFLTDPYLSMATIDYEAVEAFDIGAGKLFGIPTAGFGAKVKFKEEHPNTVAAFRRGMKRATEYARAHSKDLAREVWESAGIRKDVALRGTKLHLETRIDESELQRVPDLMRDVGMTKGSVDAGDLLVSWPTSTGHDSQSARLPTLVGVGLAGRYITCRRVSSVRRQALRSHKRHSPVRA
ncbi:ABC transporter substrate-binding protein [Actinophytocola sp.]|uniref:ABC transporter substrate-binding protein n=1 Tax=Actinophytocola sp. TaxID=1872138 RepID=UPI002ED5B9FB